MSDCTAATKTELLQKVFGFPSFRPGQEALIDAILRGRDVIGIMPTGGGKSICYQLPALMMPGVTLVISPLVSLMMDQVQALVQLGIRGAYINSALSQKQLQRALDNACQGKYKIIYLAPERLHTDGIRRLIDCQPVSMVCVDEAHCISHWGPDFRTSYLEIADFIQSLPSRPVVSAFTATATPLVQKDITDQLGLREPYRLVTGFDRPNLYFEVRKPVEKMGALKEFLEEHSEQSGIIYCLTRKEVEHVHQQLCDAGYPAVRYHAGLSQAERNQNMEEFVYDRKRLMVATNAFGMGIDKSNVSFVLHFNMPRDLESYYQEAGRAGRDGSPAECVLFFSERDVKLIRFMIENAQENSMLDEKKRRIVRNQEVLRLSRMIQYAKTSNCLGNTILTYFGESVKAPCGHCANCRGTADRAQGAVKNEAGITFLTYQEQRLLSSLKNERTKLSQKQRVAPDKIFTDLTLVEIAKHKPRNTFQLLQLTGVTMTKAQKYGPAFLRVVRETK